RTLRVTTATVVPKTESLTERARYLGHLSMLVGCTGHQLRGTLIVSGVALGGRFLMSRKRQSNVVGGRPVRLNLRLSDIEYASLLTSAEELSITVPRYLKESALAVSRGETASERAQLMKSLFGVQRHLSAKIGRASCREERA